MPKVIKKAVTSSGFQSVTYVDASGNSFNAEVRSSGTIAASAAPTVTPQGTTGATTYSYRIVARTSGTGPGTGQTTASTAGTTATGNAALSVSNFNRVTWTAVPGAISYDVYGRTSGTELFMANVTATTFDDTGAVTPSGALPGSNTTLAFNINVSSYPPANANIVAPQRSTINATKVVW